MTTYHFEVVSSALSPLEVAGEQHVIDVVACTVIKLPHVKGSWLEIVEVSFDLQALHNALLHKVNVPDLISGKTARRREHQINFLNISTCKFYVMQFAMNL